LLKDALANFGTLTATQKDRLQTFFAVNELLELPRGPELRSQLIAIGQQQLVVRPRELYKMMKKGFPQDHMNVFWSQLSIAHLEKAIELQWPTPEKVAASLRFNEPLSSLQEQTLYYLQVQ